MDDVIAIKVEDSDKGLAAFMMWGRIFGPTNEMGIKALVRRIAPRFGLLRVSNLIVCRSLSDAADFDYFYEGLIWFSWHPVPFGKRSYAKWAAKRRRASASGKEIFFLGVKNRVRRRKPGLKKR